MLIYLLEEVVSKHLGNLVKMLNLLLPGQGPKAAVTETELMLP